MNTRKIPLTVVTAPATGVDLEVPPVLIASEHSVDYTCGRCGTVVLHANEGQVHRVAAEVADRIIRRKPSPPSTRRESP